MATHKCSKVVPHVRSVNPYHELKGPLVLSALLVRHGRFVVNDARGRATSFPLHVFGDRALMARLPRGDRERVKLEHGFFERAEILRKST